jgi:PAS domain S-box-containing protein
MMKPLSLPDLEILRYSPDVVFITETDGRIVFINDYASEILGYTRAELLSMSVLDLAPSDWRERYLATIHQVVADGLRHTVEVRLVQKNQQKIPMELLLVSMPNGLLFGACRDISERLLSAKNLHALTFHEPLTQLPNRRYLLNALEQHIANRAHDNRYGALLYIDLDHFKVFPSTEQR